jgi:hypothetical protein
MVDVLFFIIKIIFFHLVVFIVYCVPHHVVCCPCSLPTYFVMQEKGRRKTTELPMELAMANP